MELEVANIWVSFQQDLRGFVLKKVRNPTDADDIIQDVFLKVLQNQEKLIEAKNLKYYLYGMVKNAVFDFFRKQEHLLEYQENENVFTEKESTDLYATLAICCIQPFIDKLPEKYKEALIDVELKGVSQKQLSEKMNISYSAAKSRVQRGREKLKGLILDCCAKDRDTFKSISREKELSCHC